MPTRVPVVVGIVAVTLSLPNDATALEAYSATAFRNSIGVNSLLSDAGSPGRLDAVKGLLREIGIVNSRGKVTPYNAGVARELYQCCGVKTLARIDYRVGDKQTNKVDPAAISQGLSAALSVGAEALAGFEGPNEYTHYQNGPGWDNDLRGYMQRLESEVRGRRLSHPIVGPTIYKRIPGDIRELGNIGGIVDASNFHIYTGGNPPAYKIDEYIPNAQIMAPGEPVWVTEFGYHNTMASRSENPVSELAAGKYIPRFAALYFSRSPRGKFFIYEFIDSGSNPSDREHHLGLLRSNLAKKPAFHTLKRLIGLARTGNSSVQPRDLAVQVSGDGGNLKQVLLQKDNNEYLLMLWQEVSSWDVKRQVDLNVPSKSVTVSVPGNAQFTLHDTLPYPGDPSRDAAPTQFPGARNSVNIDIPDHIVVLEIRTS